MVKHGLLSFTLLTGSLGIGILGYHFLEGLSWVDALVNASMILGGRVVVRRNAHDIAVSVLATRFIFFYTRFL